jgi:azurin
MHVYSFDIHDDTMEGLFDTAVYRFLETQTSRRTDERVAVHTETRGAVQRKSVTLWSADAVKQFDRLWQAFQIERASCAPW